MHAHIYNNDLCDKFCSFYVETLFLYIADPSISLSTGSSEWLRQSTAFTHQLQKLSILSGVNLDCYQL